MRETNYKGQLVKAAKARGAYARRFEDQFAVGIPDMEVIPPGGPVFKIEVKRMRTVKTSFGCTERQLEELRRYANTGAVVPVLLGVAEDWTLVVCVPGTKRRHDKDDCVTVKGAHYLLDALSCYALKGAWRSMVDAPTERAACISSHSTLTT